MKDWKKWASEQNKIKIIIIVFEYILNSFDLLEKYYLYLFYFLCLESLINDLII